MAQLKSDIQARRAAGTCVMLTVGGEGASFYLTNQTQSQNFLNSIYSIYTELGGVDGIDWDIENASMINPTQLVWIGQQLKAHYGQGFHITWAGADPSWITNGPAAVTAMVNGGALDAVDVMAYDYGQSSESSKISTSESYVKSWVSATGSASRVIIGIELPNADDGSTNTFGSYTSAITLWNWAHTTYPTVRGMDIWDAYEDARSSGGSGGTFVSDVIPAVLK
jgi:chitinase